MMGGRRWSRERSSSNWSRGCEGSRTQGTAYCSDMTGHRTSYPGWSYDAELDTIDTTRLEFARIKKHPDRPSIEPSSNGT
jgi:hypothetical protein